MVAAVESELPQLGHVGSNASFRGVALAISLVFVAVTVAAAIFGNVPGPHLRSFLAICATLWATAELLTAFFLASQFYVAGRLSYALIAVGYAFTGLLTIPYIVFFPGVFFEPPLPSGMAQVSVWHWIVWHITFPMMLGLTNAIDPTLEGRIVPRKLIARTLVLLIAGTGVVAAIVTATIWCTRDVLPRIVDASGHFTGTYSYVVAPAVVLANLAGCAIVSRRLRQASSLQLWVSVALLTAALDGLVNATSPGRYTISWYVGKGESLITASVVLLMLLFEISTLYRRLFDVASVDPLTGLANRRTLDAEMHDVFAGLSRMPDGVSLLVLDLDKFKSFNDAHGHALGDRVLRTVAVVLQACASRPTDRPHRTVRRRRIRRPPLRYDARRRAACRRTHPLRDRGNVDSPGCGRHRHDHDQHRRRSRRRRRAKVAVGHVRRRRSRALRRQRSRS